MTDRDRRQPEAPGRDKALVAADDRPVLPSRQDGLDEAELAEASLERVELVIADAARVGRVRAEVVDGDVLDGDGGHGGPGHRTAPLAGRSVRVRSCPLGSEVRRNAARPSPAITPSWCLIVGSDEARSERRPPGPRRATGETVPPAAGDTPMPTPVVLGGVTVLILLLRAGLAVGAGMRVHGPLGPR